LYQIDQPPAHHAVHRWDRATLDASGGSRPPEGTSLRHAIEIWFADEARIGQKNKITRRWAKRHIV
jgi:hypothetical protein